jgi:hypothetical protein
MGSLYDDYTTLQYRFKALRNRNFLSFAQESGM